MIVVVDKIRAERCISYENIYYGPGGQDHWRTPQHRIKAALLGLPVKEVWISILVMVVLIVACAVLAIRLFRWE